MNVRTACAFLAAWLVAAATPPALAADAGYNYKIVTASERGTYIRIGQDLATFVAPAAGFTLNAVPSAGSVENVRRLRYEPGVKFALVQSDVYQGYLDMAAAGNTEAAAMIRPLRVILPLYNEEIYFVARADAPWNYVHQIRDARINAGEPGSGTALTTATLYRRMFGAALPEGRTSYLTNEAALVKLVTDRTVDVVAVVAGQPAKLFTDMTPDARQHLKFLAVDRANPATRAALETYFPSTVRAASYPNLLAADVPSLAVRAFLVTYAFHEPWTENNLRRFAEALCDNFGTLREKGHAKWREVDLTQPPLGRGWVYASPTSRELRACRPRPAPPAAAQPRRPAQSRCTQEATLLGLCR